MDGHHKSIGQRFRGALRSDVFDAVFRLARAAAGRSTKRVQRAALWWLAPVLT